jgi:hypothetical protein
MAKAQLKTPDSLSLAGLSEKTSMSQNQKGAEYSAPF